MSEFNWAHHFQYGQEIDQMEYVTSTPEPVNAQEAYGGASPAPQLAGKMTTAQIQQALNNAGASPQLAVDNQSGPKTVTAIKKFQSDHGIASDGIVGDNTRNMLAPFLGAAAIQKANVAQPAAKSAAKPASKPDATKSVAVTAKAPVAAKTTAIKPVESNIMAYLTPHNVFIGGAVLLGMLVLAPKGSTTKPPIPLPKSLMK